MTPAVPHLLPAAAEVGLDSTTWAAMALVLTALGAAATWVVWRRRGPASGLRALAWTLVPVAAWLTGTLRLAVEIAGDVGTWATRLVFSPLVWAGIMVAAVAVGLFVVSGLMRSRGIGVRAPDREGRRAPKTRAEPKPVKAPRSRPSDQDDDMADIEAILKKHGI